MGAANVDKGEAFGTQWQRQRWRIEQTRNLVRQATLRDHRDVEIKIFGVPNAVEKEAEIAATLDGEMRSISADTKLPQEEQMKGLDRFAA